MGIECRRCSRAGRCVSGDLSDAKGQEPSQLLQAPLKADFVAGDGVQLVRDLARC